MQPHGTPASSSKPKFRSRKLDPKRPMPIMRADELPTQLDDDDLLRAVPAVATGTFPPLAVDHANPCVQEHHLQAVISAAQVRDAKTAASVYIPTPDASRLVDFYDEMYNRPFKMPKSLICFSSVVEDSIGTLFCADELEQAWLAEYNKDKTHPELTLDQFEAIMSLLEVMTDAFQREIPEALSSFEDLEARMALDLPEPEYKPHAAAVYAFWHERRSARDHHKCIIPKLKLEEAVKNEIDPFICFRRRDIRTTRKQRRADMQSLQKLRQLRSELESVRGILEMVAKREKIRKEAILLEQGIFEQRALVRDLRQQAGIPNEVFEEARNAQKKRFTKAKEAGPMSSFRSARPPARKRKISSLEDLEVPRDPVTLAIEAELARRQALDADWTDASELKPPPVDKHPAFHFIRHGVMLDGMRVRLSTATCRVGRGGRIIYDRTKSARSLVDGGRQHRFDHFGHSDDEAQNDDVGLENYDWIQKASRILTELDMQQLGSRSPGHKSLFGTDAAQLMGHVKQ